MKNGELDSHNVARTSSKNFREEKINNNFLNLTEFFYQW